MIILVSDTSVLIDLERGGLLEAVFSCGLTLVVPDALYQKELETENGPYLKSLGLGVVALTPAEVSLAQQLKIQRKALSLPDCFALCCSMRPNHVLLSGDKALRNEGKNQGCQVYGVLWLLDQMAASGAVETSTLFTGLNAITAHSRTRLPIAEVKIRLQAWDPN